MKKIFLVLLISLFALVSCGNNKKDDTKEDNIVNFYMPDGTPALAVASLLEEGFEYDNKKIEFNLVQASEIAATIVKDSCDIAICPTTAAAQIKNAGTDIKLLSNNVFGNLYIVTTGNSSSLEDLKGKIVYTTAATTIQLLQYELTNNNIKYQNGDTATDGVVTLCSKDSASTIIPLLSQAASNDVEAIGVLGEPSVTKAMQLIGSKLKIAVDMQTEYTKINGTATSKLYPQASIVVKTDFAEENETFILKLYEKLLTNENYLISNYSKLNTLLSKYHSTLSGTTFTLETIERCNVSIKKAQDDKDYINQYLNNLIHKTMSDDFFYEF